MLFTVAFLSIIIIILLLLGLALLWEQHMHSHVQAFIGVSEHFEKLYTKI